MIAQLPISNPDVFIFSGNATGVVHCPSTRVVLNSFAFFTLFQLLICINLFCGSDVKYNSFSPTGKGADSV